MKKIIRKILKEDQFERYINKIAEVMKNDYPIFSNMELYGFYDQLPEFIIPVVFNKIFGQIVNLDGGYHFLKNKRFRSVKNENNKLIYEEHSDGFWVRWEYDSNGNETYKEDSDGKWEKREYDDRGNEIYFENSSDFWIKRAFDENNNKIYVEDSQGRIMDKRKYKYG